MESSHRNHKKSTFVRLNFHLLEGKNATHSFCMEIFATRVMNPSLPLAHKCYPLNDDLRYIAYEQEA